VRKRKWVRELEAEKDRLYKRVLSLDLENRELHALIEKAREQNRPKYWWVIISGANVETDRHVFKFSTEAAARSEANDITLSRNDGHKLHLIEDGDATVFLDLTKVHRVEVYFDRYKF
jgi:hypothetical protein